MLRAFVVCTLLAFLAVAAAGQGSVQKLVETEQAFAKMAADRNTRDAFLAYMADTAVVFTPDRTDAKPYWAARTANGSLLSWAPNFADVSSNGVIGYTTGNWEWRENRTGVAPSAFGDFVTVWMKQTDGGYKWVIDMGVTHDKPTAYSTDWKTETTSPSKNEPTGEFAAGFYKLSTASGAAKAYEVFASDDIRSYREGKMPILGKKAALSDLKANKANFAFAKRSTALSAGDLGYILNTYTKSKAGKEIEKGNYLQIWKFYDGKWHIVLDVFKPVPAK